MNIDNQLLLGIVFITAGVAMGLLAYAAFLNRQEVSEEELAEEEIEGESTEAPAEAPVEEPAHEAGEEKTEEPPASEAPTIKQPEPLAEPEPIVGAEAEPIPSPESEASEVRSPAEPTVRPPAEPAAPTERPTVLVDRDSATSRLMIQVDDRTYRSMEALQQSDDWPHVTDLFSDLLAWMIKAEEPEREEEETEAEEAVSRPVSMVQEINEILSEKLEDADTGPQAVRLMEGIGGSIRVYIGVESYSIEEVPDDQVKSLIREAVAEWEDRQ